MKMNKLLLVFLFSGFFLHGLGQEKPLGQKSLFDRLEEKGQPDHGQVKIYQDNMIARLVEGHIQMNKKVDGIPGYRIRIFSESGQTARQNAHAIKSEFLSKYQDTRCYLKYDYPFFKLYVGDFRTKAEATKALKQVQRDYSGAFIINDLINYPELK
jgi:hypothetical protein